MSKSIEIQAKTIEAAIDEALTKLGASYDEVDVDIIQEAGLFKKAKVKVTLKSSEQETKKQSSTKTETVQTPSNTTATKNSASKNESKPLVNDAKEVKSKDVNQDKHESKKPDNTKEKEKLKQHSELKKDNPESNGELPNKLQQTLVFTQKLIELLGNESEVTYEITEKSFNINVNGTGVGQIIGKGGEVMNAIQTIISSIAIAHSGGENKRVYLNVEDYKERRTETLKALALRKAEKVKETGRFIKLEPMNARDRAIIHSALEKVEGIRTYSTGKDPHRCLCIAPKKDAV